MNIRQPSPSEIDAILRRSGERIRETAGVDEVRAGGRASLCVFR